MIGQKNKRSEKLNSNVKKVSIVHFKRLLSVAYGYEVLSSEELLFFGELVF
jgi:hypothetical protein